METKEREMFKVSKDEIDDFTGYGPWEINDEFYEFVEDYPSRDCDGECHNVVVQRKSDGKYFEYSWFYSYFKNYYYNPEWKEVFRKELITVEWI